MTPTREQLARAIDAIMADLHSRSGVLDGVDRDVQDEMRSELVDVLAAALAPQEAAPMPPIEVGDWLNLATEYRTDVMRIRSGYGRVSSDIEADAFNRRGRWHVPLVDQQPPDITEIRKANGTVWRRP